jgi:hypothetical protein
MLENVTGRRGDLVGGVSIAVLRQWMEPHAARFIDSVPERLACHLAATAPEFRQRR